MSTKRQGDGLLRLAKGLVLFLKVVLGLAMLGLVVALPAVILSQSHVAEALLPGHSLGTALALISVIIVLGLCLLGAAWRFLLLLGRIIDTVGEGDPFVPSNAARLAQMGWLALLAELIKLPLGTFGHVLTGYFPDEAVQIDAEFSLTGIVLAIVLFILARVFRQGTAMREDLEGTV